MPNVLQLALFAREFEDVIVFTSLPRWAQRVAFGALAPVGRALGYRGSTSCLKSARPALLAISLGEARPPCARVILRTAVEEWVAADGTMVEAIIVGKVH
jgi:hypothetical protein